MNALRKWLADRRERRNRERFEEGFGFAMAEYHLNGADPAKLQIVADVSRDFGDYNQFDAGVEQALRVIVQGRGHV